MDVTVRQTAAQRRAVDHVRFVAAQARGGAVDGLRRHLGRSRPGSAIDAITNVLAEVGAVTVNFHPGRLLADGRTVVEALVGEDAYRSQFVTRVSNGGLTAFPGGDRDRWERRMFGGAYDAAEPDEHPRYGALDLFSDPRGATPWFGSCVLRLSPHVRAGTTQSHRDSVHEPEHLSPADDPVVVVAAMLDDAAHEGWADQSVDDLLALIIDDVPPEPRPRPEHDYLETQVHLDLRVTSDVVAVTADPSYQRTAAWPSLMALAHLAGVPLTCHDGYVLTPGEIPPDFRRPDTPAFARLVLDRFGEGRDVLDAATIGTAAQSVVRDPASWADVGNQADVIQWLKYPWQALVLLGRAAETV